jgi:hypothetical protein
MVPSSRIFISFTIREDRIMISETWVAVITATAEKPGWFHLHGYLASLIREDRIMISEA